MPSTMIKGDRVPIRIWARPQEVDEGAPRQLRAVAGLPWVAHHVAVMADVHVGKGMSIGTVVALRGAIAPAAVGVDIGCGMLAAGVRRVSARPLLGPSAYKNIERVMEQQRDLVEIVSELKQVVCVKG